MVKTPPWRVGLTAHQRLAIMKMQRTKDPFHEVKWRRRNWVRIAESEDEMWSRRQKLHIGRVLKGWRAAAGECVSPTHESDDDTSSDESYSW